MIETYLKNLSKNNVLSIQPGCFDSGNEELWSVGVGSSIGHGKVEWSLVLEFEVLIGKFLAIDTVWANVKNRTSEMSFYSLFFTDTLSNQPVTQLILPFSSPSISISEVTSLCKPARDIEGQILISIFHISKYHIQIGDVFNVGELRIYNTAQLTWSIKLGITRWKTLPL